MCLSCFWGRDHVDSLMESIQRGTPPFMVHVTPPFMAKEKQNGHVHMHRWERGGFGKEGRIEDRIGA